MSTSSFFNVSVLFYNEGSSRRSHGSSVPPVVLLCCLLLNVFYCHEWLRSEQSPPQCFFGKGEVVVRKGMQLEKKICLPAISILSQALPLVAAAKHLLPGPALNSCSANLSVKPNSDFGISFFSILLHWALSCMFSTARVAKWNTSIVQHVHRMTRRRTDYTVAFDWQCF